MRAYEMRISDWSSDVCSSDLVLPHCPHCSRYFFPPPPRCPVCLSPQLQWERVSGYGRLRSWTDVYLDAISGIPAPFTIAEFELSEIGCASCGVRVCQYGKISLVAVSLKKKKQSNIDAL